MSDQSVISEPTSPSTVARDGAQTAASPSVPSPAPTPAPAAKQAPAKKRNLAPQIQRVLAALVAVAAAVGGYFAWQHNQPAKLPAGFASSNGRMEATEIDVAAKVAGRLVSVLVDEGDFVTAGQVVGHMDTDSLNAQLREAEADLRRAKTTIEAAQATVRQREKEKAAAEAVVKQREAELDAQMKHFERIRKLAPKGAATEDELDHSRAEFYGAQGGLEGANAQVLAADAAIATAKAQVIEAEAGVEAAQAKIERLQSDLKDCTLNAPREGRVQYRVAQPGEVLYGGGKVLNMVDLNDVYMTFFLPTEWAGRVSLGSEVRLVLDGAPEFVIPAKVTFVADVAQFTPKTVETAEERQKLTFRVKAHIPEELLKQYVHDVKTGVPGVAYVQVDPKAEWPAKLQVKLPPERHSASSE
jgi:HlyD family secretion protein